MSPTSTPLAPSLLLLLLLSAIHTLWISAYQNGLLASLLALQNPGSYLPSPSPNPNLAGSSSAVAVEHQLTGFAALDGQLVMLNGFFWPALDGSRVDISLLYVEGVSKVASSWVVVWVESGRGKGWLNSTLVLTLLGLLMQGTGFGLIMPIWTYMHLANSTARDLVPPSPLPLLTLPLSILLSCVLPNTLLLLSLLSPTMASRTQLLLTRTHFWSPLLTLSQLALLTLLPILLPSLTIPQSESAKRHRSLRYLRRCYTLAFLIATAAHVVTVSVPVLASLFPGLFNPVYLSQLELRHTFVPRSPLPPIPRIDQDAAAGALSFADAVHAFLQWDMVIGSAAFLVWAMSVRIRAQERGLWFFEWVEWVVKVGGLVAVAGPVGAGVALVWERDEMWFEREFFKEKEGRRVKEKWAE